MANFIEQPIVKGSTPRFRAFARLDNVTWDLTGGTVEIFFGKPDDTVVGPLPVPITDAATGETTFQALTSTFDQTDRWWYQRKYSVGGIIEWSKRYYFNVEDNAE